jgi:hypothetical protein
MTGQNGGPPKGRCEPDREAVFAAAILLLHVVRHEERGGLSNRVAVLSAASQLGVDPVRLLHRLEEVRAS